MEWINIIDHLSLDDYAFYVFCGGRGGGKTYSTLTAMCGLVPEFKPTGKFMLVRRTQKECAAVASADGILNPFKSINFDYNTDFTAQILNDYIYALYDSSDKKDTNRRQLGYLTALTTVGAVAGGDFPDVDYIIVDEFIAKKGIKKISSEFDLLMGLYETVNRNREFKGKPPVYLIMLSNSNNIYNPYFAAWGVIPKVERIVRDGGVGTYKDHKRSLYIELLPSPEEFADAKSKTAIARLTAGTAYGNMAYKNEFAYNDFSMISRRHLQKMRPVFAIDDCYLWIDTNNNYYCTYAKGDVCNHYRTENTADRYAIRRRIRLPFIAAFESGKVTFESYDIKYKILSVILEEEV